MSVGEEVMEDGGLYQQEAESVLGLVPTKRSRKEYKGIF
jgi:hypothetical protein